MQFPNISQVLPVNTFNSFIQNYGMRFTWSKAHACPCTYGTLLPGQGDNACLQCGGYGTYWDAPSVPFNAFITFRHLSQSPDEPGIMNDKNFGMINQASPMITVSTLAASGTVWAEASLEDAFTELDSTTRYETTLTVGGIQAVPYQKNATGVLIAASGAVTTYDTVNHTVIPVSGYTVSGGTVTLPSQYPTGTAYTVSWHSNPIYFCFRKAGGMPHVRPPGGLQAEKLPRGFHLQPLDLWTRARISNGFTPNSI